MFYILIKFNLIKSFNNNGEYLFGKYLLED